MAEQQLPADWSWIETPLGWTLLNKARHELGVVNNGVIFWSRFSWSARRTVYTLWGDSKKGAPAKDLEGAQAEVLRHVLSDFAKSD